MIPLLPEIPNPERWPEGFASSLVLPALRHAQEQRGWVAEEDIERLVRTLGVARAQIDEVLGFYTQFRRAPVGRFHLQVCRNVSCSLRGGEQLLGYLERRLGIRCGQTSADGRFSLATAECLGSCGTAPVMMVNDGYHEALDAAAVDALLGRLAGEEGGVGGPSPAAQDDRGGKAQDDGGGKST